MDDSTNVKELAKKKANKTKGKVGRPKGSVAMGTEAAKVVVKDEEKNKAPNFHEDEDELIAQAWVSASENEDVGVGQKTLVFWEDVHNRYFLLQQKSLSPHVLIDRSWNQIKGRFLRHIQPGVSYFN